jgi:hypothetical protein
MEKNNLQNKDNNIEYNSNNNPNNSSKKTILNSIINRSLKCSNQTIEITGNIIQSIIAKDKNKLIELCSNGLPDDLPMLRSLIWKINFDYLPINSEEWSNVLQTQRKLYEFYKEQFLIRLNEEFKLLENFNNKTSKEKKELEEKTNKVLLEEIKKDVNRTHSQLSFFFQPTNNENQLSQETIKRMMENRRNCTMKDINDTYNKNVIETHADVVSRILFIYAKFSPDIKYVQGMNEIISPIYYCYSFDKLYIENDCNIEADTFWSFYNLMDKIKSVFIREEDGSDKGILGKSKRLKELLKIIDIDIYNHFIKYKLDFSLFSLRWFILFFSQDFLMIDILRLWDFLFCEENKFINTFYTCLAIILMKKDSILNSDLPAMMEELQRLDIIDVEMLIINAKRIKEKFGEKCEKILKKI